MKILIQANMLAVGLDEYVGSLRELPIRLIEADNAIEAVRFLRDERFEVVLSKWQLDDMRDGLFQRRLRMVKPDLSTIVLIDPSNSEEEIMARSTGATAVLTEDCGGELLINTVCGILGLEAPVRVGARYKFK